MMSTMTEQLRVSVMGDFWPQVCIKDTVYLEAMSSNIFYHQRFPFPFLPNPSLSETPIHAWSTRTRIHTFIFDTSSVASLAFRK